MDTQTPPPPVVPDSQKYEYVGLLIGAVITVLTVGSFYFNMKIDDINPIGVPIRTIPVGNTATSSSTLSITPASASSLIKK